MTFEKRALGRILLALAVLVVAEATPSYGKSLGVVKVNYGRSIDDLPLYVGLEEGFWEQEGLKVELVSLVGEINIIAAALHDDIQGGHLDVSSACHAALRNIPIKVVAWMGRAHSGTRCGLHVDAKSNIHTIKDLKGARIATSGHITTAIVLDQTLAKAGMSFDDVRLIKGIKLNEAMKHEAALRSKGVDVIVA
jgi:ABC-type nitrate/sulfonate/bicarbonate transport system substrate-binding protein